MAGKIAFSLGLALVTAVAVKAGLSHHDSAQKTPGRVMGGVFESKVPCEGLFSQLGDGTLPAGAVLNVVSEAKGNNSYTQAVAEAINAAGGSAFLDGVKSSRSNSPWKLRQPMPEKHWTLVVGAGPKQEAAGGHQQAPLRIALFDESEKAVAKWQANNPRAAGLSSWSVCQGDSRHAKSVSEFLGMRPADAAYRQQSAIRLSTKIQPVPTPAAAKKLDWAQAAEFGSLGCDVQVEQQGRESVATVKGAANQTLTFVRSEAFLNKKSPQYSLFDCSDKGVRVLTESTVSDFTWEGQPLGDSSFLLQWLKREEPRQLLKLAGNEYLVVQPGAEVAAQVSVEASIQTPLKPPSQSEVELLEKRGVLKKLSAADVERIQDEYRSSRGWATRVGDWFTSPDKKVIKTDLPHAHQYWLITKQIDSVPSIGTPYSGPHGTVFFVDKGVAAPRSNLRAARVLDLNTWTCIGETFWCPWPEKR